MKDLSTLEYLYECKCCNASSETHSCFAVSAEQLVNEHSRFFGSIATRSDQVGVQEGVRRTFARRHGGMGDGRG